MKKYILFFCVFALFATFSNAQPRETLSNSSCLSGIKLSYTYMTYKDINDYDNLIFAVNMYNNSVLNDSHAIRIFCGEEKHQERIKIARDYLTVQEMINHDFEEIPNELSYVYVNRYVTSVSCAVNADSPVSSDEGIYDFVCYVVSYINPKYSSNLCPKAE